MVSSFVCNWIIGVKHRDCKFYIFQNKNNNLYTLKLISLENISLWFYSRKSTNNMYFLLYYIIIKHFTHVKITNKSLCTPISLPKTIENQFFRLWDNYYKYIFSQVANIEVPLLEWPELVRNLGPLPQYFSLRENLY